MSLRYANLAPDQHCEAVARLVARPTLSVTVQLPWMGPLGKTAVELRQAL
jgi:hypothetical protein